MSRLSQGGCDLQAAKKRDFMTGSTTVHSEVRPSCCRPPAWHSPNSMVSCCKALCPCQHYIPKNAASHAYHCLLSRVVTLLAVTHLKNLALRITEVSKCDNADAFQSSV